MHGKKVGALDVGYLEEKPTYDEGPFLVEERDLINAVAKRLGRIVERKRAENELAEAYLVERRYSAQMASELDLASKIQQDFMEASSISMDGLEIMASWIPAHEMSGDFFSLQPLDDHRLSFWVGDVSAKGVPAGLFMVLINTYLHAELANLLIPGDALSQLSLDVCELLSESEQFTTLFLDVLDTSSGMLTYSDAGHGHALIHRHASKTIEKLSATAPPLGIESQLIDIQKEVGLNPSDVLLIYSDDITETMSPSGELFGEQRLMDLVKNHPQSSAAELCAAILASVEEFRQDSVLMDDQTLLVIRRTDDAPSEINVGVDQVNV